MIQLNLLPDVKLEYIKAESQRRLFIAISALAIVVSLGILVLNFGFGQLQKKHLNDVSNDILTKSHKLQSQPQINTILTVQNQLQKLTALHDAKPATNRVFGYLNQLTPVEVSISTFDSDLGTHTITLNGSAKSVSDVNRYVDTLKFTTYTTRTVATDTKAFSNVVLSGFAVGAATASNQQPVTYTITFNYDPIIFASTEKVELKVRNQVTTRSEMSQASDLFQATSPKGKQ